MWTSLLPSFSHVSCLHVALGAVDSHIKNMGNQHGVEGGIEKQTEPESMINCLIIELNNPGAKASISK